MARILFVQPSLQPPGGGNSVGVWMLQAIVAEHDVTVFTWRPVEFDAINRFYGTSLRREDVELREVPRLLRAAIDWIPLRLALLRTALLGYRALRLGLPFDLAMSANNEAEFGLPNIQYIHYPAFTRPRPLIDIRWVLTVRRSSWISTTGWRIDSCRCPWSACGPERTFVNLQLDRPRLRPPARWISRNALPASTALVPRRAMGGAAERVRVHRPARAGKGARTRARDRRRRAPHVPGRSPAPDWLGGTLGVVLRPHAEAACGHSDWVTLHLDVSRDELVRLITTSRYGIHGMTDEHFGMAPAEMVAGGCLTWVHNSGGQVEIVNGDPRFTYDDADDAVTKILRMMSDGDAHETVRAALRRRTREFSVERFQERVGGVVAGHARRDVLDATLTRDAPGLHEQQSIASGDHRHVVGDDDDRARALDRIDGLDNPRAPISWSSAEVASSKTIDGGVALYNARAIRNALTAHHLTGRVPRSPRTCSRPPGRLATSASSRASHVTSATRAASILASSIPNAILRRSVSSTSTTSWGT